MHTETNRFKTYTQLEKTYHKILARRSPAQCGQPRPEFRQTAPAPRQYSFKIEKSDPLIRLRQDT